MLELLFVGYACVCMCACTPLAQTVEVCVHVCTCGSRWLVLYVAGWWWIVVAILLKIAAVGHSSLTHRADVTHCSKRWQRPEGVGMSVPNWGNGCRYQGALCGPQDTPRVRGWRWGPGGCRGEGCRTCGGGARAPGLGPRWGGGRAGWVGGARAGCVCVGGGGQVGE